MCESIYLPMRNQSQLKGPTRLSRYCFYLEGAVIVRSPWTSQLRSHYSKTISLDPLYTSNPTQHYHSEDSISVSVLLTQIADIILHCASCLKNKVKLE